MFNLRSFIFLSKQGLQRDPASINNKARYFHTRLFVDSNNCTQTEKLIEHIYGFLMIVERILEKYEEKKSGNQSQ